ncbi:MAG: tetratricopeptide repeat protein [Chitinophagales bacterium]
MEKSKKKRYLIFLDLLQNKFHSLLFRNPLQMSQTSNSDNNGNPTLKIFLGLVSFLLFFIFFANYYSQLSEDKKTNYQPSKPTEARQKQATPVDSPLKRMNEKGAALLEAGELEEALAIFTKASQEFPDAPAPFHNMGIVYGKKRDWKRAIDHYEKAIALKTDFTAAYYSLGVVYQTIKDKDKAVKAFQDLIKVAPKDKKGHLHLGILYDEKLQFDKALQHYHQAINADAKYYTAFYNIGNTFLEMKELDSAAFYYQGAIRIKPDYSKAYVNLAHVLNQKGDSAAAQQSFKKALELDGSLQDKVRK